MQKFRNNKKIKTIVSSLLFLFVIGAGVYFLRESYAKYEVVDSFTLIEGQVPSFSKCNLKKETSYEFIYTGDVQTFIVPCSGSYQIELWGAQGGNAMVGGHGAYTTGTIYLKKNDAFYIYVGSMPTSVNEPGYNGGGVANSDGRYFSGGGATDVRLVFGSSEDFSSLKSRIMVAAGGGGGYFGEDIDLPSGSSEGGYGGALVGGSGNRFSGLHEIEDGTYATGGTQTDGGIAGTGVVGDGKNGKFGLGADGMKYFYAGGGGGYYGGGSSGVGNVTAGTGGGGSSYISGFLGCNAIAESSLEDNINHINSSQHYSNYIFTEAYMLAGNDSIPTYDGSGTMIGNTGNGFAKITFNG